LNIFQTLAADAKKVSSEVVTDAGKFAAWLSSVESPSTKATAGQAGATISTGLNQAGQALEGIAVDGANAALGLVPGGLGLAFEPLVDNLLISMASKILGKASNPAAAAAAVAAAVSTPAATSQSAVQAPGTGGTAAPAV
jgi:hypothetical protein